LAAVVPELLGRSPGRMVVERALLFEALLEVVEEAAGDRVTAWLLEDLHWADPSTLDFVVYAARRVGLMALALVVTFRDEDLPQGLEWSTRFPTLWREPDTVEIVLDRLDHAETRALIQALDPLLPVGAVERITERTAGTPLLVEKLVATFGATGRLKPVGPRPARLPAHALDVLTVAGLLVAAGDIERPAVGALAPSDGRRTQRG